MLSSFRVRSRPRSLRALAYGLLFSTVLSPALPPVAGAAAAWAADGKGGLSPTLGSLPDVNIDPELIKLRKNQPGKTPDVHQGPWGVFNAQAGVAAGFGPVARYGEARWAEDWSYLRDPTLRDDIFDPLKFVKLNNSGTAYITFSGDERLRNIFDQAPFFGYQSKKSADRILFRSIYGADVHLGEHFRIYTDVVSGQAWGHNYFGYNGQQRTNMDFLNLFGELKGKVLGAQSGIMVGRQQFLDAPNYMIYAATNPNVKQTWEGVRGYMIWSRFRIDLFDLVRVDQTRSGAFKFSESWGNRIWGAYSSYALPSFKFLGQPGQVFADLYYIGYLANGSGGAIANANVNGTTGGSTHRNNYGVRLWGSAGPLEFSLGGTYQGGEFRQSNSGNTRAVDAYASNNTVAWRFAKLPGKPSVGLQADYYSGGNYNKKTGAVGTFIAPFSPATSYLDPSQTVAPGNLISVGPTALWAPLPPVAIRFHMPFNWRASTDDAVYGTSRIYSPRSKLSGGFTGFIPQISVAWRIDRHLTFTNDFEELILSDGMRRAGAKGGFFWMSTLEYQF